MSFEIPFNYWDSLCFLLLKMDLDSVHYPVKTDLSRTNPKLRNLSSKISRLLWQSEPTYVAWWFQWETFWIHDESIRRDAIQSSSWMKLNIFTDICYRGSDKCFGCLHQNFSSSQSWNDLKLKQGTQISVISHEV